MGTTFSIWQGGSFESTLGKVNKLLFVIINIKKNINSLYFRDFRALNVNDSISYFNFQ